MFQLSGPSDRIGTSRNATTVPIAVATAKASIVPEDLQRWHATRRRKISRQERTRSEQEGQQQRAGGAEHAAGAAAEVGAEEQQRDGQRQQVVERHAVGRGVRRHHAGAAGRQTQQHAHQSSGQRLPHGAPLLRPGTQRGGAQEEGPVAPVVRRRNKGGACASIAARWQYLAPADTATRRWRRACNRKAARVVAVAAAAAVVKNGRSCGAGRGEDGRGSCHPAEITGESTPGQVR
jgi:hypothetical protein